MSDNVLIAKVCMKADKMRKGRSEGGTYHDYHDCFNTPPDSSGSDLFSKPVKPSSDRGIFFGLILSLTTSQP